MVRFIDRIRAEDLKEYLLQRGYIEESIDQFVELLLGAGEYKTLGEIFEELYQEEFGGAEEEILSKDDKFELFTKVFSGRKEFTFHPNYQGRNSYKGPAVSGDDLEEMIKISPVKTQWDRLGKEFIVYPR